ncbi:MAG TPA: VTT domain-containing protein [Candidatus Paceibacterota bacterium]|jgi:membrane protein DedA with SNARE-associated domain|nr:VTT domain-containing protein [Candidatus Paceibacterota bacterium]
MTGVTGSLLSFVLLYKYWALFVIVYLGAIIIPWPVNITLLAIGAFASQNYFSFWFSLTVAVVANTLGDLTDYAVTRYFGERVIHLLRLNKIRFFNHLQAELRSDAAVTVFMTRFAGSLSSITNFLAGLVAVPLKTFFIYDLIGNIIEPFSALFLGYLVGSYWNDFSNLLSLIGAIVAVVVLLFILLRMYRRIMKKYELV